MEFVEKADIEEINPNKLASTYLGTEAELYDAMLKATLIGAVKRIFDNGRYHLDLQKYIFFILKLKYQ